VTLEKSVTSQAVAVSDNSLATNPEIERTLFRVLAAVSFCHLLNDMLQSMLPAIYPILKNSFHLDFGQIGIITLVFQCTASLLQPIIGAHTDKRPMPYSLPVGMTFTLAGIILLALAPTFGILLFAAALIGMGSAVFHPESSRVARMASGGKHGLAQSFFQVGGNTGSAIGPLLAALIVLPRGQIGVLWFSIAALGGIVVLLRIGRWYKTRHLDQLRKPKAKANTASPLPPGKIAFALAILISLIFSKYFYLAGLTSYYTFYLMTRFKVSVENSQIHLFVFLGAVAAGTFIGGPAGDRFGRKRVIWCSILGVLPFTLLLPHANLFWTGPLSVIIGFILSSAFSAILVYGQELIPGRVGMISGLFFGFAFGIAGIGAAVLGKVADMTSIVTVYKICAWLPAIGLLTAFLPEMRQVPARSRK
jgi:FSR family fosmidomycin resistance protein-like MFS transporter